METDIVVNGLPDEAVQAYLDAQRLPLSLGCLAFFLAFAAGVFLLLKPDFAWEIQHLFTVRDGKPTDLYLICARITGVLLMIVGIVCLILTIGSR